VRNGSLLIEQWISGAVTPSRRVGLAERHELALKPALLCAHSGVRCLRSSTVLPRTKQFLVRSRASLEAFHMIARAKLSSMFSHLFASNRNLYFGNGGSKMPINNY
jgi:hypothetical protein